MDLPGRRLKIGILGAASVAKYALIAPARRVPEVEIAAVASRDPARARRYARRQGIPKSYGSYAELIRDPEIELVYNALPNSLHAEWSIRALEAGKHVLCEKPLASNAEEAERMLEVSRRRGRVLVEALHSRHHPLYARLREIVASGELGAVRAVTVLFCLLLPFPGDIRFRYELAGGATMDVGCYAIELLRFLAGEEPEVVSAAARLAAPRVDGRMDARFRFPSGAEGRVACSLVEAPWNFRILAEVEGSEGVLRVLNPFSPQYFYSLKVSPRRGAARKERLGRVESTYLHQLRNVLAHVRTGAPIATSAEEAIRTLKVMDSVYEKAGLPRRGAAPPPFGRPLGP